MFPYFIGELHRVYTNYIHVSTHNLSHPIGCICYTVAVQYAHVLSRSTILAVCACSSFMHNTVSVERLLINIMASILDEG